MKLAKSYTQKLNLMSGNFISIRGLSFISLVLLPQKKKKSRSMATSSSNRAPPPGEFTTLKQEHRYQMEIKKSKFIAIAAPLFDDSSALTFLSQVRQTRATHNCWAYKVLPFFFKNK